MGDDEVTERSEVDQSDANSASILDKHDKTLGATNAENKKVTVGSILVAINGKDGFLYIYRDNAKASILSSPYDTTVHGCPRVEDMFSVRVIRSMWPGLGSQRNI